MTDQLKRNYKPENMKLGQHRITVNLTKKQKEDVLERASRVGRSASDVLRQLIDFDRLPDVRGY